MYKRILVPVDGSDTARLALREAIKLAGDQQAELRLIHVIDETMFTLGDDYWTDLPGMFEALRRAGQTVLDDAMLAVRNAGLTAQTVMPEVTNRRIASVVVEEAERWPADLVVIGTHGRRGFDRMLLGSVAEGVMRISSKPVLLIRGVNNIPERRVK